MEKIKLCFLAPEFLPPWGGVGISSVNLIKGLSKIKDIEIHVLTPERGRNYNKQKILNYFDNKIYLHNISKANDTFFYNFTFQNAVLKNFDKLNKKYNFDLIHSANLVHMPDIWLKFKKIKVPSIVTVHTTIGGQVQGFLKSNKNFFKMALSEKMSILAYSYIKTLEWFYLKKTSNVLTLSNKFAEDLMKKGFKGKIEVTPNVVDLKEFDYDKIKFNQKLKRFKGKKKIILYAGRIITQKGIELFVKLMKDVDACFVIAGSGNPKIFFDLIKKYKIPKQKFMFLGFVEHEDLPSIYKASDIFVLPSYYENFSISLLEAMAMKNACIASNAGATEEIIDNGKNGFVFEIGDYNTMKDHVNALINDKRLRKKIAEESRKKILRCFTIEKMANKTFKFYLEVLNR